MHLQPAYPGGTHGLKHCKRVVFVQLDQRAVLKDINFSDCPRGQAGRVGDSCDKIGGRYVLRASRVGAQHHTASAARRTFAGRGDFQNGNQLFVARGDHLRERTGDITHIAAAFGRNRVKLFAPLAIFIRLERARDARSEFFAFFPHDFVAYWQRGFADFRVDKAAQLTDCIDLARAAYKRVGHACPAGAAGAADTVDVMLELLWDVKIKDGFDVFNIDPARSHVGRYKDARLAVAEALHNLRAAGLLHIAMDAERPKAVLAKIFSQAVDHCLGIAEHDSAFRVVILKQEIERIHLARLRHAVEKLLDRRDGTLTRADVDRLRVAQEFVGDFQNRRRHGGGKQDGLTRVGRFGQNRLNVVEKTHIEHFVRFIKNDGAQTVEAKRMPAHMVHHAPRRTDYNVGGAQRADLGVHRRSAVDGRDTDAGLVFGEFADLAGDLHGKLARGRKHQHLRRFQPAFNALHGGDAERGRFAGAGARAADYIGPLHQQRDRLRLDTGGLRIIHITDGLHKLRRQADVLKFCFTHKTLTFRVKKTGRCRQMWQLRPGRLITLISTVVFVFAVRKKCISSGLVLKQCFEYLSYDITNKKLCRHSFLKFYVNFLGLTLYRLW